MSARKIHKWAGIIVCFFMVMFSISGIILNHRQFFSGINVSRSLMPDNYQYQNWNRGLLRGTISFPDSIDNQTVLIYGSGGVWKSDKMGSFIEDYNQGLPTGADLRAIRSIVLTSKNEMLACSQFKIYRRRLTDNQWTLLGNLPEDLKLYNITLKEDTLYLADCNAIFRSVAPYNAFQEVPLNAPANYDGKVSLMRTIWLLHSGELFGLPGKLIMDAVALVIIFLSITGILFWLLPKRMKWLRKKQKESENPEKTQVKIARGNKWIQFSFNWHDLVGRKTIVLTLLIALTGWSLRSPFLMIMASNKTKPVPFSYLDKENPFFDKIRGLYYDEDQSDWILCADKTYSLQELSSIPVEIGNTPAISVMGINVFEKDTTGDWLVGSFSGLFRWNRSRNTVTDYFTGEAPQVGGSPFAGGHSISGYASSFPQGNRPVEYGAGTDLLPQPEEFNLLPTSLWSFSFELHNGRLYTAALGTMASMLFILLIGIVVLVMLWTGWMVRKKKKN